MHLIYYFITLYCSWIILENRSAQVTFSHEIWGEPHCYKEGNYHTINSCEVVTWTVAVLFILYNEYLQITVYVAPISPHFR